MLTSLDKLNSQIFRRQMHTEFRVIGGSQPVTLELVEVQDQGESQPAQIKDGSAGGSQEMESFSLHFRGPYTPQLGQKIHRLEHAQLGAFDIFLTPISAEPQAGTVYEVVFHRFRQPS